MLGIWILKPKEVKNFAQDHTANSKTKIPYLGLKNPQTGDRCVDAGIKVIDQDMTICCYQITDSTSNKRRRKAQLKGYEEVVYKKTNSIPLRHMKRYLGSLSC